MQTAKGEQRRDDAEALPDGTDALLLLLYPCSGNIATGNADIPARTVGVVSRATSDTGSTVIADLSLPLHL